MTLRPVLGGSVLAQLRASLHTATPAARAIGEWLLEQIDSASFDVAAMTTGTIARAVGCSRASVVRFVRSLDFESFAAFHVALAVELTGAPPKLNQPDALERMARISQAWLQATLNRVDAAAFEGAVQLLATAGRRVWYGVGDSAHLAASADHRCAVLGMPSQAVSAGPHLTALLPSCGTEDCLIAISQSGRSRPSSEARKASAVPLIGITSVPASRLAKAADYLLLTPQSDFLVGEAPLTVRAAQALVVDALLMDAATRRGTPIKGWTL